jgi:hypothetical protein
MSRTVAEVTVHPLFQLELLKRLEAPSTEPQTVLALFDPVPHEMPNIPLGIATLVVKGLILVPDIALANVIPGHPEPLGSR